MPQLRNSYMYKKGTGKPRVTYDEAVEEALCFGWIDSKGNKLDDEQSMLWCAPPRPGSGWSRPNKERVERLLAAELMMPAGLAKITTAKADGSWDTLDAVEALEEPPDLQEALAANPAARQHWDAFPRSQSAASWNGSRTRNDWRRAPGASRRPPDWPPKTSAPTSGAGRAGYGCSAARRMVRSISRRIRPLQGPISNQ